ncbi:hypothetical protein PR048_021714 [Dryococelus australis]|uniref:Uncharacterized protein n=1 Tax=Dryococelus australis TaxID=614101 RepID=A0ABQ9GYZ0_9NEOP|nr:hypothetical protein PR048_021714 [Dryococelus australis]
MIEEKREVWKGGTPKREGGEKRKGARQARSTGTGRPISKCNVAERLSRSPPKANRVQSPAGSPDFRIWELCQAILLVSRFSRRVPISPTLSFRRCSILISITLTVKSHPNLFTHSASTPPPPHTECRQAVSHFWCGRAPQKIHEAKNADERVLTSHASLTAEGRHKPSLHPAAAAYTSDYISPCAAGL